MKKIECPILNQDYLRTIKKNIYIYMYNKTNIPQQLSLTDFNLNKKSHKLYFGKLNNVYEFS